MHQQQTKSVGKLTESQASKFPFVLWRPWILSHWSRRVDTYCKTSSSMAATVFLGRELLLCDRRYRLVVCSGLLSKTPMARENSDTHWTRTAITLMRFLNSRGGNWMWIPECWHSTVAAPSALWSAMFIVRAEVSLVLSNASRELGSSWNNVAGHCNLKVGSITLSSRVKQTTKLRTFHYFSTYSSFGASQQNCSSKWKTNVKQRPNLPSLPPFLAKSLMLFSNVPNASNGPQNKPFPAFCRKTLGNVAGHIFVLFEKLCKILITFLQSFTQILSFVRTSSRKRATS